MKYLTLFFLCMFSFQTSAIDVKPDFEDVELKEFTSLNIEVMPDVGTQLIFPFLLDNPELLPDLKISLSNSNGFAIDALDNNKSDESTEGQNTIVITANRAKSEGNPTPVYLGNLFITIGGYNLSIALKTTYDVREVVTNYRFNVSEEDRKHLVEHAVNRHKNLLDKQYQEQLEDLDTRARKMSLGKLSALALMKPRYTAYRLDDDLLINGERLVIGVDEFTSYGSEFHVLTFDVENFSSRDFMISSLSISGSFEGVDRVLNGDFECPESIKSDGRYHCAFATLDGSFINADSLSLSFSTDRGLGVFKW